MASQVSVSISTSSLLLLAFFLVTPRARSDLVRDTCKKCAEVDFNSCARSLESDPRSRGADLRGLGLVSFDLLRGQLASTGEYIRRIMSRKWDPYTRRCLSDCKEMYGDSSSRMEDVIPAYRAGRYADVQTWLSGVLTYEDTCESQFSERGKVSPLTKQNRDTLQLGTIALCIVDFCQDGIVTMDRNKVVVE
ncbi:putative invertase inhibitor [Syzygium oleosum]|uniref:putative invertase inhibitor n=1 Tax=Syzygium oleosum TaxID=219896 RepID=UPI0011D234DB|nr:putative invertase inhibitor [Syzygium oleosum]